MTLSNKRKKARKKYRIFRGLRNIKYCEKCGEKLDSDVHHFLCNNCWKKEKREKAEKIEEKKGKKEKKKKET